MSKHGQDRRFNVSSFVGGAAVGITVSAIGIIVLVSVTPTATEQVSFDYPIANIVQCTNGIDGLDGVNGQDGINGKDGVDGKDGRNALPAPTVVDGVIIEYQSGYEGEVK